MSFSRRGIFGLFAGAPVAAAAATLPPEPDHNPEFFVGQIRTVHKHFETRPVLNDPAHTHGLSGFTSAGDLRAVAVVGYEQWNGKEWVPIAEPRP